MYPFKSSILTNNDWLAYILLRTFVTLTGRKRYHSTTKSCYMSEGTTSSLEQLILMLSKGFVFFLLAL
jgi:hypothetical protein